VREESDPGKRPRTGRGPIARDRRRSSQARPIERGAAAGGARRGIPAGAPREARPEGGEPGAGAARANPGAVSQTTAAAERPPRGAGGSWANRRRQTTTSGRLAPKYCGSRQTAKVLEEEGKKRPSQETWSTGDSTWRCTPPSPRASTSARPVLKAEVTTPTQGHQGH